MTTTTITPVPTTAHAPAPNPRDVFLKAQGVFDRYGWKKSAGYERLKSPGFPRPLPGGLYRLDTLYAWEDTQLAALDPDTDTSPTEQVPGAPMPPPAPAKRTGGRKPKITKEQN